MLKFKTRKMLAFLINVFWGGVSVVEGRGVLWYNFCQFHEEVIYSSSATLFCFIPLFIFFLSLILSSL